MLKISCITLVIAVVISLVYILYLKKNIHKYEMILTDILNEKLREAQEMDLGEQLDKILEENKKDNE
ncbi:MAG: hypothetical protein SPJ17_08810 [Anaeroplasma sp.]|uniref:hypothetical protein n=1 Tax=Anaeroplasma sp. TaxID=1872523 RepID=UPI002A91AAD0|nr:hypothetical protein [Anaeroplasma sp.]MDY5983785.1 hypothetical protein [Anaeroplasma sp.]